MCISYNYFVIFIFLAALYRYQFHFIAVKCIFILLFMIFSLPFYPLDERTKKRHKSLIPEFIPFSCHHHSLYSKYYCSFFSASSGVRAGILTVTIVPFPISLS